MSKWAELFIVIFITSSVIWLLESATTPSNKGIPAEICMDAEEYYHKELASVEAQLTSTETNPLAMPGLMSLRTALLNQIANLNQEK